MLSRYERGARAPHLGTLSAILTALGLTLHDLADAIDEVAGRNPPQRSGRPETHLVAQIVARGGLSGEYLDGLAAKSTATPEATADFVATVLAAATALAERAIERARAEAAQAGGGGDPGGQKR
ncbi:MAG: hypothetical protein BWX64_01826 [Acidobacteria bacterium ADurb.Bin051]|jgi:transcriptional regulator with XRE-family HTH domain|nr:MAG: hypothetical protein BWX64_01826 [Acidobacteria bacterium ADurb.Bin051]